MHQHFEQGLVSDTFAGRDFSSLRHIGFRQSQRYLNAVYMHCMTSGRCGTRNGEKRGYRGKP